MEVRTQPNPLMMKLKNPIKAIFLTIVLLLLNCSLSARTWLVANGSDKGIGSLRECITLASNNDTISLIQVDTVVLSTAKITIDKNLTIQGHGAVIERNKKTNLTFHPIYIASPVTVLFDSISFTNGLGWYVKDSGHEPFDGGGAAKIDHPQAKITYTHCRFENNRTLNRISTNDSGSSGYGGAIFLNNGTLTLINCYFGNNSTGKGYIEDPLFATGGSGGAIYMWSGNLLVQNSIFENNSTGKGGKYCCSSGGAGGAIYKVFGTLRMENTKFIGNRTGSGGSGHIESFYIGSDPTPTYLHIGSGGGGDGGAIYNQNGEALLINCDFIENKTGNGGNGENGASGGDGGSGGAILNYMGSLDVQFCNFHRNSTGNAGLSGIPANAYHSGDVVSNGGGSGGAIYTIPYGTILNSIFEGNSSGNGGNSKPNGNGGAVYVNEGVNIKNSLFYDNFTSSSDSAIGGGLGGALYAGSGKSNIFNSTFAQNDAIGNGGAIYANNTCSLTNSIMAFNEDSTGSNDLFTSPNGRTTLNYCLLHTNQQSENKNINLINCLKEQTDPGFRDTLLNNFSLKYSSPCLNAGDPKYNSNNDSIKIDLHKQNRVKGGNIDIGAYEYLNENCSEEYVHQEEMFCAGDNYLFGDSVLTNEGRYLKHYFNSTGCDSFVCLNLIQNSPPVVYLGNDITINKDKSIIKSFPQPKVLWNDTLNQHFFRIDSTLGIGTSPIWVKITDEYGCSSSDTIMVTILDSITSSNAIRDVNSLRCYPNPTNGITTVECSECDEIELLSEDGKLIWKDKIERTKQIDLRNQNDGVYFILIRKNLKITSAKKVVKTR